MLISGDRTTSVRAGSVRERFAITQSVKPARTFIFNDGFLSKYLYLNFNPKGND